MKRSFRSDVVSRHGNFCYVLTNLPGLEEGMLKSLSLLAEGAYQGPRPMPIKLAERREFFYEQLQFMAKLNRVNLHTHENTLHRQNKEISYIYFLFSASIQKIITKAADNKRLIYKIFKLAEITSVNNLTLVYIF